MSVDGRIVIVGASLAGWNAATTLRREGFDGELVVVGSEQERPYDRPPLSKAYLATGEESKVQLTGVADSDALAIEWRLGRSAVALQPGARLLSLDDGTELAYDGLVLSCGARVRTLDAVPLGDGVHALRTLADARRLRDDLDRFDGPLVVVGAGFIGAEVAATCRQAGRDVILIEAAAVPLERAVGAEVGEVCAALHRDHDVDVRLGTGVEALDGDRTIRLTDGSTVAAGVIVIGVGVAPNTEWLRSSGLELRDGVCCDATLLAAPGVVAAGDVARWPNSTFFGDSMRVEHWDNAIDMGSFAARRLLAGEGWDAEETYAPVPWFWSDQYDRKMQMAGRATDSDRFAVVGGTTEERRFVALYGRKGRLVAAFGMNRPRQIVQCRTLIAQHCAWEEALQIAADWT